MGNINNVPLDLWKTDFFLDLQVPKIWQCAQGGKNSSQIFETLNIFNIHKTGWSLQAAMGRDWFTTLLEIKGILTTIMEK